MSMFSDITEERMQGVIDSILEAKCPECGWPIGKTGDRECADFHHEVRKAAGVYDDCLACGHNHRVGNQCYHGLNTPAACQCKGEP